jgi:hypothetical protein
MERRENEGCPLNNSPGYLLSLILYNATKGITMAEEQKKPTLKLWLEGFDPLGLKSVGEISKEVVEFGQLVVVNLTGLS